MAPKPIILTAVNPQASQNTYALWRGVYSRLSSSSPPSFFLLPFLVFLSCFFILPFSFLSHFFLSFALLFPFPFPYLLFFFVSIFLSSFCLQFILCPFRISISLPSLFIYLCFFFPSSVSFFCFLFSHSYPLMGHNPLLFVLQASAPLYSRDRALTFPETNKPDPHATEVLLFNLLHVTVN